MEEISKTSSIETICRDKNKAPDHHNGLPLGKERKRKAPMHLLKVALYVLRLKSRKSKSQSIQVAFSWKRLLGSIRPMHLQSNELPPLAIEAKPATIPHEPESVPVGGHIEEAHMPLPLSPMAETSPSPVFSMSSHGSVSDMSQYESPLNYISEFRRVKSCEEIIAEEEFWYDEDGGDEMIDAKAEEFIAQFYEQMRLQNLN